MLPFIPMQVKSRRFVECQFYFEETKAETLAIVGESGSGKSVTTRTLMGLNAKNAHLSGKIDFQDKDLSELLAE